MSGSRTCVGRAKQTAPLRARRNADGFHNAYREWLKSAENTVKRLKRQGIAAQPVILDIDEFIGWCAIGGLAPDGKARAEYAGEMLGARWRNL
jgi:hypothetical protein